MLTFLRESIKRRAGTERILWILLVLFVFSISFSIAVSQIFLTGAFLVYLFWKGVEDHRPLNIPLLMPVLAFSYCILLSVVFSIHPSESLFHAKDLALFIILPMFYDVVRNTDDIEVIYGILILAGLISATYGIYQFFGDASTIGHVRIHGFMSNWMTFSGFVMILNVLLLSNLLFLKSHPRWFYPAFLILSTALILSLTRNAWLGFLSASFVLISMRKLRWVIAVPVVAAIVFMACVLIFPATVGSRMQSLFNPNETTARDRILMLEAGRQILKDYPITGVGSGMIPEVYPRYRAADSVFRKNQHLHNNLIQLAAENGLLALAAWFWLIGKIFFDLIHWKRNVMTADERFVIYGTIGIVVALIVAGMFEYNFGDSEIKMLFLVLISLPYAWHRQVIRVEAEKAPAAKSWIDPAPAVTGD